MTDTRDLVPPTYPFPAPAMISVKELSSDYQFEILPFPKVVQSRTLFFDSRCYTYTVYGTKWELHINAPELLIPPTHPYYDHAKGREFLLQLKRYMRLKEYDEVFPLYAIGIHASDHPVVAVIIIKPLIDSIDRVTSS